MDIDIADPRTPLPVERCHAVSMVIKSFKGRRDVEVHLFRPRWDPSEESSYDWDSLLDAALEPVSGLGPEGSRKVILESFTRNERDQLVAYLKAHYATRLESLASSPLDLPLPYGLPAFSDLDEGKDVGFIRFERIPHFNLPFPVHGLYDLSRHRPIVEGKDQAAS